MSQTHHAAGRWPSARWVASPNADARPADEVSLIVLHAISLPPGKFGGDAIEALFTNRLDADAHPFFAHIADLRVSAHFLIRRDGACVQFVEPERRAWHAGRSCWRDPQSGTLRRALNDFAVGIELEGDDDTPFRRAQYARLAELIGWLRVRHRSLSAGRITGHAHVAPLRKTDPGPAFDWAYLDRALVENGLAGL